MPAVPACRAQVEGQLSCQANRVCECVFKQAVPARNLPNRWAWDCGIKRPACRMAPAELAERAHRELAGSYQNPRVFVTIDAQGRRRLIVNGQSIPFPDSNEPDGRAPQ